MTLVFPAAHAAVATREALGQAFFWFASVLLAVIFIAEIEISLVLTGYPGWLTLPMLTLIWISALILRSPVARGVPVVVIGGAVIAFGVTSFGYILANFSIAEGTSATFLLTTLKIAVVLIGAMVDRWSGGSLGALVGYAVAEAAVQLGIASSPRVAVLDIPALAIAIGAAVALQLLLISRRRTRQVESPISLADAVELAARERRALELRSSALVHDTILNELATLATTLPGPLSPKTVRQIRTSIELVAAPDAAVLPQNAVPLTGALLDVIERLRREGLDVEVGGELHGLDSLDVTTATALAQAIEQCLVNVLRHSGVTRAELTVMTGPQLLTAMVMDAGAGFVESDVESDRFGLRTSVRGRIATVGGSVQVWSSPGAGTSVMITVPMLGAAQ